MSNKAKTLPLDPDDLQFYPAAAPTGSLATPRENLHAFTPLSPKHRLNPRGTRLDALDNSLASMPSHFAKVAP